ncbi:MAG: octaprenyl diphosphate synthase [Pseudomonadales bacterium]|nr:octaprenyl diphosphate synthase [Pseudomonadales bacterium]
MDFNTISSTVAADFEEVNRLILKQLHSKAPLVGEVGKHIINSGGKRLRPLISLLSARACGYEGDQHIQIAAVVEFLHTATLLHDDVVDESSLRRGKATANALWGNAPSVLVGDFLISRSFQMVVAIKNIRIMEILSDATNLIAEGEVLQLANCNNPKTTEAAYMEVIHHKTAKMFEAAAQSGAVLANRPKNEELALASYAIHLGSAFQLIDDVLDYTGDAKEMGKNVGDDLAEGKPTLPLIYAIKKGNKEQASMIANAIKTGGLNQLHEITAAVHETGAIDYTIDRANTEANTAISAIECISNSIYKEALVNLAKSCISRRN